MTAWPPLPGNTAGWAGLYAQLQVTVAALDPNAHVQVEPQPDRLRVRAITTQKAAAEALRDACFDAQMQSKRTCRRCGAERGPGTVAGAMACAAGCGEPAIVMLAAPRMIDLRERMIGLLDAGWVMTRMLKPVMEGAPGAEVRAWFAEGERDE